MAERPNLTSDSVYPIRMGKAPPRAKREKGYNDSNATMAAQDKIYLTGRDFNAPQMFGVDQQTKLLSTTWGTTAALGKSEPDRYEGAMPLSRQMAIRNQAGPQQAIIRNQKFHTTSNHKVAVASLQTIEKSADVAAAAKILEKASSTYPLNKMRIPQMPDRFKIRKKFYDNNIEFTLKETGQGDDPRQADTSVTNVTFSNMDYKNVKVTRGVEKTIQAQLNELKKMLTIEMGRDVGMRSEYYNIPSTDTDEIGNRRMNVRGEAVLKDLMYTAKDKRWYTVKLTKADILGTEAITSSNAWYDENLYKKEVIGQSVKIGTPTYQIQGIERPRLGYNNYGLYRVPMFAYVQVKYKPELVREYVQQGLDALKWQQKLWTVDAFTVAETQIKNAARNYVAVLSPQYKSLDEKVKELDKDKDTIFKNYNETAKAKGRMGMDNALSKMRFTDDAVQETVNQIVKEYDTVWKHVTKAKSLMPRPSWGQIKIKHIDKVDQIVINFQDNYGIIGSQREAFDQIRISCNLKEVALTYKAVVSPWVRQISLNHSLMVQWKKNFDKINGKNANYVPTRIFGDRGQEIVLPKLMLSRPKYISFKKKKRNLYATWLTLGNWISLANDPNTAAALRFNSVINQDSYLLIRQLEGVLDAVLEAARLPQAANPKDLKYHAFQVLFSRVVHKAEPGFKSAGIDGSKHAHFKLFDIGNTKGKYIRLNYANNAIGKKNVINLRARLRQFLRHMKKLNSVNQIFQTQVKDRGFEMNMMEIAGNCVMLSMASKFLPNHDFFTYIDNDDMVEQVKGNSMNTVMQMLTLMQAQKVMRYTMGDYCINITTTINKMAGLAQQTVRRSFASDFMRNAQQKNSSDRSTADSDSSNPMVALSKIDLAINYQSGQYNNSNLSAAKEYGQNKGLEQAFKLSINSVIRCKQLKQSTVAIITKDLEIFQMNWVSAVMPGAQDIAKRDVEESVINYDNALKRFGVQNFVGNPINVGSQIVNGIDGNVSGIAKGHQPFMDMIAFYRGFIEIMDTAGQLFTLYQLRVYKGATDEEFMAFLLYYLEISRQVIVLLLPRFLQLRLEFLWKSAPNELGVTPQPEAAVLNAFMDKQLKSEAFATFEYRIVWGLQEMIGRIRQPSAAGQPSMRTIGYKMSVNSFPDAPLTSIAGENKYGRPQNVLIEANKALDGYDGKAPVQPQKMGRTQLGGNLTDVDILNPRQINDGDQYDFIEGGVGANVQMD